MKVYFLYFLSSFLVLSFSVHAQIHQNTLPVERELSKRFSLTAIPDSVEYSNFGYSIYDESYDFDFKEFKISISPLQINQRLNTGFSYGWDDRGMQPVKGYQGFLSGGINLNFKFLRIEFNPEFYFGGAGEQLNFLNSWSPDQIKDFYFDFNYGDFPQYFGDRNGLTPWWGQSKITAQLGAFEAGLSFRNTWWGPGQWNTLTFSNNAQGFPHLSFNTTKPAKTFAGNLEMQFLMGKLASSNLRPTGIDELDDQFFDPLSDDWRYVNGLGLTWYPKWVKGLSLGFSRTVQQYSSTLSDRFLDLFPVFQGFQKKSFFENGNSVNFDQNGQDQQFTVFGSYRNIPSKFEFYFEFGRRDHAFSWRDFVLSPEHASAYIFGFLKLIELSELNRTLQIRSEISHQQESVNRYIRYLGLMGLSSWHMHHQARGFTNFGQPLGVGIGPGGNIQTMEVALMKDLNKVGFLIERREHRQGFFYRSFGQQKERKPWIDLSLGFLYDKKFGNLLVSSKLQFIHARNYQWQLDPASTPDFPKGENMNSFLAQTSLIYFWNK